MAIQAFAFSSKRNEGVASSTSVTVGSGGSGVNNYLTGGSFNVADGIITLTRKDLTDVTFGLDGRYALISDVASIGLQEVTDVNSITTNAVTIDNDLVISEYIKHKDNLTSYFGFAETDKILAVTEGYETLILEDGVVYLKYQDATKLQTTTAGVIISGDSYATGLVTGLTGGYFGGDVDVIGGATFNSWIKSNNNNTQTLFSSYNTSVGDLQQLWIAHNNTDVDIDNFRGDINILTNLGVTGTINATQLINTDDVYEIVNTTVLSKTASTTVIHDYSEIAAIELGGTANPSNYHNNTSHYFRPRGGASNYMVVNSTGIDVTGTGTFSSDLGAPDTPILILENTDATGGVRDSAILFKNSAQDWLVGMDDSNSDAFTISSSTVFTTERRLTILSHTGEATFGSTVAGADATASNHFITKGQAESGVLLPSNVAYTDVDNDFSVLQTLDAGLTVNGVTLLTTTNDTPLTVNSKDAVSRIAISDIDGSMSLQYVGSTGLFTINTDTSVTGTVGVSSGDKVYWGSTSESYIEGSSVSNNIKVGTSGSNRQLWTDTLSTIYTDLDIEGDTEIVGKTTVTDALNPVIELRNNRVSSSWVVGDPIGTIDFYSADTSGGGNGVKAQIGAFANSTTGGGVGLKFKVGVGVPTTAMNISATGIVTLIDTLQMSSNKAVQWGGDPSIRGEGVNLKLVAGNGEIQLQQNTAVTGTVDSTGDMQITHATNDIAYRLYKDASHRAGFQWDTSEDVLNIFSVGGDIELNPVGNQVNVLSDLDVTGKGTFGDWVTVNSDSSTAIFSGAGVWFERSTSYLRPSTNGTQTLKIGESETTRDWYDVQVWAQNEFQVTATILDLNARLNVQGDSVFQDRILSTATNKGVAIQNAGDLGGWAEFRHATGDASLIGFRGDRGFRFGSYNSDTISSGWQGNIAKFAWAQIDFYKNVDISGKLILDDGDFQNLEIYNQGEGRIILEAIDRNLTSKQVDIELYARNGVVKLFGGQYDEIMRFDSVANINYSYQPLEVTGNITATGGNSSEWNTAYDRSLTSMSFDDDTGILTLSRQDDSTYTESLDGRYSLSTDLSNVLYDNVSGQILDVSQNGDTNLEIQNNNTGTSSSATLSLDSNGNNLFITSYGDNHATYGSNYNSIRTTAGGGILKVEATTVRLGSSVQDTVSITDSGIDVIGDTSLNGYVFLNPTGTDTSVYFTP